MMPRLVTFALAAVMAVSALALSGLSVQAGAAELMMFEEDGCVWCARWDAEVAPDYARSEESRIAPLVRYDLRRDPLPDALELKGRVRYTPTFVLVENDREVGRIIGYPGKGIFWLRLDDLMSKLQTDERPPLDTAKLTPADPLARAFDG